MDAGFTTSADVFLYLQQRGIDFNVNTVQVFITRERDKRGLGLQRRKLERRRQEED